MAPIPILKFGRIFRTTIKKSENRQNERFILLNYTQDAL
jgi:hypothetical protein